MKVYIPSWFQIKVNWRIKDGPANLFDMATRARKLEVNDRDLVFQRIQCNAYFLHPENVLLSMIADVNLIIQKLGWKRLKKARDQMIRLGGSTGIRCFDVPKVIFEANSYHEAIDWSIWQNDDNDNIIYPYPLC